MHSDYRFMEITEPLRDGKKSGYCTNRSRLEQMLIGVVITVTVIAVILLILVIRESSHVEPAVLSTNECRTSTCIQEAARILRRIDTNVNPCDDFYLFACGNFLKESHGNGRLNDVEQLRIRRNFQHLEMYAEDIRDNDHKMVKSTKKLFRKCLNVTEIEEDNLSSTKEVLKEIGGWPVLYSNNESLNWNEANFDWLKATYKLRELGYPFSMFLGLDIQKNEKNKKKYIFKVKLPERYDPSLLNKYSKEHTISIMTEIAMLFGAQDRNFAYKQMTDAYQFWNYNPQNPFRYLYFNEDKMTTVADFQEQYGNTFNWLEFINNITGPTAQILMDDYVLLKGARVVRKWIDFIASTPKRTLANYMMWKVIEEQLPYLTMNVRNLLQENDDVLGIYTTNDETRAEFCLTEIQKRFIVSPVQIMYSRKYLPLGKRKQIEDILSKMKLELVNLLKNTDWMEKTDKQLTVAKAETINIVVGLPGNYFDDKMLNALDVDMVATKTDTFLNLLAQANRNYQTSLYNQIKMSASENVLDSYWMKDDFATSTYYGWNNMAFIPVIATQEISFEGNRPNYLNYGPIGRAFGGFFWQFEDIYFITSSDTKLWSNKTKQATEKMGTCLLDQCQLDIVDAYFEVDSGLGEEIAYVVYGKWSKINGEEQELFGLDYSPRQLFWISNAYCLAASNYSMPYHLSLFEGHNATLVLQQHTCGTKSNSFYFAKDFGCPVGSKMNPVTKCKLW